MTEPISRGALSLPSGAPPDPATPAQIANDVAAVGRLATVPKLLELLCGLTGMRFAAVARVDDETWTACVVRDEINFGLKAGGQLELKTTLCHDVRKLGEAIAFDHASTDSLFSQHHTPRIYKLESYISVPIILANGRYFGNLCAIDPSPAEVSNAKILGVFRQCAEMVAIQLESELLRQETQLALNDERAAGELREQFIAVLGHDLRNPVQAVSATGEMIARRSTDPVVIGMAHRLKTTARRMSALIDDVMDFARGRLGKGIGIDARTHADIDGAVSRVVEELQDVHPNRQIVLDLNVKRAVVCDIGRLQQVISNLVANALSHGMPSSVVEVVVTERDDQLVITVWNDGDPIPAESIAKIFHPFWRNSTAADREGLGLGLHICSQIVKAHNGTISVESSREAGTRFTVQVPVDSTAASASN